MKKQALNAIQTTVNKLDITSIPEGRMPVLHDLIHYIREKSVDSEPVRLNFICTHNSRRSQLSQLWAQVMAYIFGVEVRCYSGGTEATAFNERTVASIRRAGFRISQAGEDNPHYTVDFATGADPLVMYSKTFDDDTNPTQGFAAIMTCSDADENCPFIAGADVRIPLRYEDPKAFDGTGLEAEKYDERSLQIATELLYVFSQIDTELSNKNS
jgi:arsenate reductase